KPRRSRARSRKTAKTAVEPTAESSPVTWIRVGPGQFVRADGRVPAPFQSTAEPVAPEALPATDESLPAAPEPEAIPDVAPMVRALEAVPLAMPPAVPLEVLADPARLDSPESAPEGEPTERSTGENDPESIAEEYGIAPSAFDTETEDSPSSPSLDPGVLSD